MTRLAETLLTAVPAGLHAAFSPVLRTNRLFLSSDLGPAYPFLKWRNDPVVDRELRRYLGALASKGPFIDEWTLTLAEGTEVEFKFGAVAARGLTLAFAEDQLAVSLSSAEQWDADTIELSVDRLAGDDELTSETVIVRHASRPAHLGAHQDWIVARLHENVDDGEALANRSDVLFPRLDFCESALAQLRDLPSGQPLYRQILKKLRALNEYCLGWKIASLFTPDRLGFLVTLESQATLSQYGAMRMVRCPDGESRTFSWHARLTPASWRLYFHPEPSRGVIIVGYIGPHLPTVQHP